ncbi:F-box/FBD/LRR-repeat protein At4g26340-like isoform X2 [Mercurialis annua]|uniref:F-box/FBD/LRR-repeat protein At4g26340-like isoform X2 n=1 Tax=Mercurialis annua TaxID=3986 RepID=UPI002160228E|nr:F-box/FBD/LRR-repeat protein At4g26340-like isoform X2 [Mercurialis annua]
MEKRVKAEDYASQLPQHLLHHILSFLSLKQIIQTSVLSKTWYRAWNTLHILKFDFLDIFSDINRAIYEHTVSAADRWIGYALESRVKELKVANCPYACGEKIKYSVPQSIFHSNWIQVLHLRDCELKLPFSGNVKLSCLKQLTFGKVYVDDNFVRDLLAGSPMLEDISLIRVFGIKELNVFNLVKLGKIHIEWLPDLEKLALLAPNLESITLIAGEYKGINLGVSCKYLSISLSSISDKWLNEQLKRLPHLENLKLYFCPKLERIEISNPLVSKLLIQGCAKLSSVQIDAPCLRYFTYIGDIVSVFSSTNRITLSEVSLDFYSKTWDITWYVRLIELLANFNTSFNVLKYVFKNWTGKWVVIPEEVKNMAAPPLSNVKELGLQIQSQTDALPMSQLEDAMSWIAPHPQSLSISINKYY